MSGSKCDGQQAQLLYGTWLVMLVMVTSYGVLLFNMRW